MSQPVAEVGGYKNITATGDVTTGPCQLLGFYINSTTAGTLVLKDGGASGTTLMSIATVANGEPFSVVIPANGVLFETDVHATLSNAAVTVFYG